MCMFSKPKVQTPEMPETPEEPAELKTFASNSNASTSKKTGTQRLQIAVGGSKGGSGLGVPS